MRAGTHLSSVRWPHMIWAIVTLRSSMLYGTEQLLYVMHYLLVYHILVDGLQIALTKCKNVYLRMDIRSFKSIAL